LAGISTVLVADPLYLPSKSIALTPQVFCHPGLLANGDDFVFVSIKIDQAILSGDSRESK
jgi:hypothetical protein